MRLLLVLTAIVSMGLTLPACGKDKGSEAAAEKKFPDCKSKLKACLDEASKDMELPEGVRKNIKESIDKVDGYDKERCEAKLKWYQDMPWAPKVCK